MADSNRVLIVCRDFKSARKLSHFKPWAHSRYILASDDPKVQEAAKGYPWIDETHWIERMESFYNVALDVIRFRETIDRWLKSLANEKHGISDDLLWWPVSCEGGMTTQRIQDLLLLIRSYLHLINLHSVKHVIIFGNFETEWESSILIEAARCRQVSVSVMGHYRVNTLYSGVRDYFEILGRGLYYTFNFFRVKCGRFHGNRHVSVSDKEIIFQLCSSAQKDVKNIIPMMKALQHKEYKPVALCWSVTERYVKPSGADQIRGEGLTAEELEGWGAASCVLTALLGVLSTWQKARAKYQEFSSLPSLEYESVPLARFLWPSVRFFLLTELLPRYIFNVCIKNYLQSHSPAGIKIWNQGVTPEGYFVLKNINKEKKPLIFYWNCIPLEKPYDSGNKAIDLYLSAGDWHRNYLERRGVTSDKIAAAGVSQFDNFVEFANRTDRRMSFKTLGIPPKFSLYILCDTNYIVRGYMCGNEQAIVLDALIKFANTYPTTALLVKPHPRHRAGMVEDMIDRGNFSKNIFLVNKTMLPCHALNVADILITKFSTIGLEAMIFEKPVISILLDSEERLKIYQDAVTYFFDEKKMYIFLEKLVNNNEFYLDWRKRQVMNQNEFLKLQLGFDPDYKRRLPSSELAAAAIDDFLKKRAQGKTDRYCQPYQQTMTNIVSL